MTYRAEIAQQLCCEASPRHKPGMSPFRVGPWRIDPGAREARTNTMRRRLSPRALGVLALLENAKGETVSRGALLDEVWPDVVVSEESLTQAVAEIRRVLGPGKGGAQLVETVPKCGYRLAQHALAEEAAGTQEPGPSPAYSLEAHLMMIEASQLAVERGYAAADQIDILIDAAYAMTPGAPTISVRFVILKALAAQHCGARLDRLAVATDAINATLLQNPRSAAAYAAAGFTAAASGQSAAAGAHFARALSLDPNDAETHYLGAQAFFALGDLGTALSLSEKALRLDLLDYRPAFIAARAAEALGDTCRARALAGAALQRVDTRLSEEPDCARWRAAHAALRAMQGEPEPYDARPSDSPPYFYDLVAASASGEPRQAINALEMLLDHGWRNGNWLQGDPVARRLKNEPRFARMVEHLEAA